MVKLFTLNAAAAADAPAFVFPGITQLMPLKYPQFVKRLRGLLARLGLPHQRYAGHSFRRGGATYALQAGLPADVIMQLGDWKSDAYRAYLDIPLEFKAMCVEKMAQSLFQLSQ